MLHLIKPSTWHAAAFGAGVGSAHGCLGGVLYFILYCSSVPTVIVAMRCVIVSINLNHYLSTYLSYILTWSSGSSWQ